MDRYRDLYSRLSTCSKRSLLRRRRKFGHAYQYNPRPALLNRLAEETGRTEDQIRDDLLGLRQQILRDGY